MSDDMDLDLEDDFEDEAVSAKSSAKEMWDNNPFLKIGLLVIIAVMGGFFYTSFIASGDIEKKDQSIIRGGADSTRGTVGEASSPEYRKAIEETNEKRAEVAKLTKGSALPTPIAKPRGQLEIQEKVDVTSLSIDPLQEWRKTAEARRFEMDFPEEEIDETPVPEMVPIIEPIRPEMETVVNEEMTGMLAEQMATIIGSKEPRTSSVQGVTHVVSEYMVWKEEQEELEQKMLEADSFDTASGSGSASEFFDNYDDNYDDEEDEPTVLISAGDVVYAQLLNNLNSDIPGPALAHILSGPLAGARAIGSFKKEADKYLILEFNMLVKDGISYPVSTFAMDPKTTLGGLVTDVDNHYFKRIILPAASEFISGIGEGIAQIPTTVTSTAGGSQQSTEALDTEEIIATGVQKGFDVVSKLTKKGAKQEITVTLDKGTPMGLLFTETLYDDEGE